MRLADALIAWTPCDPRAIKIGTLESNYAERWDESYKCTCGGCFAEVAALTGIASVARVFVDFNSLVVRDGIDVDAAHKEFLKIDEYRTHVSPDIDGAE